MKGRYKMSMGNSIRIVSTYVLAALGLTLGVEAYKSSKNIENASHQLETLGVSTKDRNAILEKSKSTFFISEKADFLQSAIDSVKNKGKAEKAYFEGAQAVRDSLAKATKKIKL